MDITAFTEKGEDHNIERWKIKKLIHKLDTI
jgi:hypothetical protein